MTTRRIVFAWTAGVCLLSLSACAPTAPSSAVPPPVSPIPAATPGVSVARLEASLEMVEYRPPVPAAGVETLCPSLTLKEASGQSGVQLDWIQVSSPDDLSANFGTNYIWPRRIAAGDSRPIDLLGECVSSGRGLNEIQVAVTFRDDEGRAGGVQVTWQRATSAPPATGRE